MQIVEAHAVALTGHELIGEITNAIQEAMDRTRLWSCSFRSRCWEVSATRQSTTVRRCQSKVVTADGRLLFTGETIRNGQNVWQSTGGQEIGTIWGHGAYVAPDWSADYLHRQSVIVLNRWARASRVLPTIAAMPAESRAALQGRLTEVTRHNTYDPATDTIVLDDDRAAAFEELAAYYADVYGNGRNEYAIPAGALTDVTKQREMATFFWWTAWAASTNRPGQDVTYTQNWPHEELIGNRPTGGTDRLERDQLCPSSGRNWRNGLVLRLAGTQALTGDDAAPRSAARVEPDAFAEGYREILLRGRCAMGGTGRAGRDRCALRRRGRRLLRNSAGEVAAIFDGAHLASSDRHLLDRNLVARDRPVHRSRGERCRTEGTASWA